MAGGAILDLNPSLVQYVGGYGRAAKAIGDSMVGVGQAKLDLAEKQAVKDEKTRAALDLRNGNISTNRLIAKTYGNDTIFSDEEMAQFKPEQFRAMGKDGFDMMSKKKEAETATAQKGAFIDQVMKDKPQLFTGMTRDQLMGMDLKEYMATKETVGGPITTNKGDSVQRDRYGTYSTANIPDGQFVPEANTTQTMFKGNKPIVVVTNKLKGTSNEISLPIGAITDGQKGRQEGLSNSLTTIAAGGKETRKNQTHAGSVNLDITDKKEVKEVTNSIEALTSQGYNQPVSEGFIIKQLETNPYLDYKKSKVRGVEGYYIKGTPNK